MGSVVLIKLEDNSLIESNNSKIIIEPPEVLGRGTLLKCGDKKISRKHALLDWDENGILITSTHINATYITTKGTSSTLTEGKSVVLSNGDCFGFLPDAFWYKLIIPFSPEVKPSSSVLSADVNRKEELLNVDNSCKYIKNSTAASTSLETVKGENIEKNSEFAFEDPKYEDKNSKNDNNSSNKQLVVDTSRERKLPSWMDSLVHDKQLDSPEKSDQPKFNTHGKKKSYKRKLSNESMEKKETPQTTAKKKEYHAMSVEYDVLNENAHQSLHTLSDDDNENLSNDPSTPKQHDEVKTPVASTTAGQNVSPCNLDQDKYDLPVDDIRKATNSKKALFDQSGETSNNSKNSKRLSCSYGGQCYRKNSQHKLDMAHPGDSDYISEEDKPECEFGVKCYRKNSDHKATYKHTRKPQPRRKAAKIGKAKPGDENEEDDYDDPFLNDASSDDYAPTDSDSDSEMEEAVEEENTHRMVKEAKKFMKNK